MVTGMLLAGGVGKRIGAAVPKQFLEINGKPIILYPLEIMENHPEIDQIEIVCVEEYIPQMWNIVKEANLKKVKWITPGGETCQDSTRNGLENLKPYMSDQDIVLIHMASYPLASDVLMSNCIHSAMKHGNGCVARPIVYSVFFTDDRETTTQQIDRDKLMLCTIPYAFRYGECMGIYERAYQERKGIDGNVYTNTLYCDFGKTVYFTSDSEMNIKVTTPEDLTLMKAILSIVQNS